MDNFSFTMNLEERNHHLEDIFALGEEQASMDREILEESRAIASREMSHPHIKSSNHTHKFENIHVHANNIKPFMKNSPCGNNRNNSLPKSPRINVLRCS